VEDFGGVQLLIRTDFKVTSRYDMNRDVQNGYHELSSEYSTSYVLFKDLRIISVAIVMSLTII